MRKLKMSKTDINSFNEYQRAAIDSKVDENILISAGAGSGKTKTLSYKVYKLVAEDNIDPSSILVLTFTKKAAFEMKERIIQEFKNNLGDDSILANKIVSAHIQNFDSFSSYLVKKYASALQIPDSITIINDNVLKAKKNEILDGVLKKFFETQSERVYNSFSKFCCKDNDFIKRTIFEIDDKLNTLLVEQKNKIIRDYNEIYLNRDYFFKCYDEYVSNFKDEFKKVISKTIFKYNNVNKKTTTQFLINAINIEDNFVLNDEKVFSDYGTKFYNYCLDVLSHDSDTFLNDVEFIQSDDETNLFNSKSGEAKLYHEQNKYEFNNFYKPIVSSCTSKKNIFVNLSQFIGYDFESLYEVNIKFKDDISLLFEILIEMNEELDKFKRENNSYTFADIQAMALSLVVDEKYIDIRKQIQDRFKYVLVDEYQDTNDIQETFINALSMNATLFCVGDAKQSIYRFRNSNVKLFMDRKDDYEKHKDHGRVISMNYNYRSSFELLSAINSIFDRYMTLSHGGIDYKEMSEGNMLQRLDHAPDFTHKKATGSYCGLGLLQFMSLDSKNDSKYEIQAIIKDIKNKIDNHYKVYDFENKCDRDVKYSDFAILVRMGKTVKDFKEEFVKANIPLNVSIKDKLTKINSIILLKSIIAMIVHFQRDDDSTNVKHLFASIARSYIYGEYEGYDDEKIFNLIKSGDYLNDEIVTKVKKFAIDYQYCTMDVIFLGLLNEFNIITKLPFIGEISFNIEKIESFYNIILEQARLGQNLDNFLSLLELIDNYKIDMDIEDDIDLEDAVNMMTIHKSKGLEFPIVYMPLQCNLKKKYNRLNANQSCFSVERGVILPDYTFNQLSTNILCEEYDEYEGSDGEEINEHVRLFYVALTRAKECLYIVSKENGKHTLENLNVMLSYLPNYLTIKDEYMPILRSRNIYTDKVDSEYKEAINEYLNAYNANINNQEYQKAYREAAYSVYYDHLNSKRNAIVKIVNKIGCGYLRDLVDRSKSLTDDKKCLYYAINVLNRFDNINLSKILNNEYKEEAISFFDEVIDSFKEKLYSDKTKKPSDSLELTKEDSNKKFITLAYVIDGIKSNFMIETFSRDVITDVKFYDCISIDEKDSKKKEISSLDIKCDDSEISFAERNERIGRASKEFVDDELNINEKLEHGTLLHSYLEYVDFISKDTSFIKDSNDKKLIDNVLKMDIFKDLEGVKIYHEYSYFDPVLGSKGSIDLLLVHKDHIDIIDYKTLHIDETYDDQLLTYQRNIERLFKTTNVNMYLLSIIKGELRKVIKNKCKNGMLEN